MMEAKEQGKRTELSGLRTILSDYQKCSEKEKVKLSKYMGAARAQALIDVLNLMKLPELITLPDKINAIQDELSDAMGFIKKLSDIDIQDAETTPAEENCWIVIFRDRNTLGINKFYGTKEEVKKYLIQEAKEEETMEDWVSGPGDVISMIIEHEAEIVAYFAIPFTAVKIDSLKELE